MHNHLYKFFGITFTINIIIQILYCIHLRTFLSFNYILEIVKREIFFEQEDSITDIVWHSYPQN